MVMGPTHEEVITDLARNHLRSYRDLPKILYQIQTKFRDEARPRSGVIRSREFIMKDAYSFDAGAEGLEKNYNRMFETYVRIFERCGLKAIPVEADTGVMGGDVSHEFMVLSDSGEDIVAVCGSCGYAASLEKAEVLEKVPGSFLPSSEASKKEGTVPERGLSPENGKWKMESGEDKNKLQKIHTPGVSSVEKVSQFLKVKPSQLIKTLIYLADGKPIAALVRGDHEINEAKLRRAIGCQALQLADPATIQRVTGASVGFSGPVGLKEKIQLVADFTVQGIENGVIGANEAEYHLTGVVAGKDFQPDQYKDIRYMTSEDPCPKCSKKIEIKTAIEMGHIFKLGLKYSKAMGANFLDQDGKEKPLVMGCYGIGVNRILAAAIEQSHDENGVIWPFAIAPFQLLITVVNAASVPLMQAAEKIYQECVHAGIEVLLDDRDERAGVKFKDADLIGIPYRVVVGEKNLAQGKVEIKKRQDKENTLISPDSVIGWIKEQSPLQS
jgi:prolyl-tRNA synthetase